MGLAINDFEPVLAALLTHITSNVEGFLTTGRRVLHWSDVPAQPALFLRQNGISDEFDDDSLGRAFIKAEIWIYQKASVDPKVAPGTALNTLVKAVRDCFRPDDPDTHNFTLGGLVTWCRIEGDTDLDPGDEDDQSKAAMTVRILFR